MSLHAQLPIVHQTKGKKAGLFGLTPSMLLDLGTSQFPMDSKPIQKLSLARSKQHSQEI